MTRQNAFVYDECVSGSIIYAYVGNSPVNWRDPTGKESITVNAGIISGTIGVDNNSGLAFYSFRVGIVGLGITIDPNGNAPVIPGSAGNWQTGNISAGVTGGPISWQPIKYDLPTVVNPNSSNGNIPGSNVIPGGGLNFNPTTVTNNFSKDSGKSGLSLDLSANYERGGTLTWQGVREFLGLSPLSTGSAASGAAPLSCPGGR